jgi:hypothetical protein
MNSSSSPEGSLALGRFHLHGAFFDPPTGGHQVISHRQVTVCISSVLHLQRISPAPASSCLAQDFYAALGPVVVGAFLPLILMPARLWVRLLP